MRKSYLTTLLSVGVALASLSSCSRASYSFNSGPAYLGSERVRTSVATAAPAPEAELTASADAAAPATVAAPAHVAATALVRHHAAPVAAAVAAETAAPAAATTFTKAERKELKQLMRQDKATSPKGVAASGKSQMVAAVLCFFVGGLGVHRFYLGYTGIGILMLFTFGLFGILTLIDFVRILTGSLKPKDGDYTTKF